MFEEKFILFLFVRPRQAFHDCESTRKMSLFIFHNIFISTHDLLPFFIKCLQHSFPIYFFMLNVLMFTVEL